MANHGKIIIPKIALETFISVSSKQFTQNKNHHVETLAFLIGHQDGETIFDHVKAYFHVVYKVR